MIRRVGVVASLAVSLAMAPSAIPTASAATRPPCPQLEGWVGPIYPDSSSCDYQPGPGATVSADARAYLKPTWVVPSEQGPGGAMPYAGCGKDVATLATRSSRVLNSGGWWAYVEYGVGGVPLAESEAILRAEAERLMKAATALLKATEGAFAKSCTTTPSTTAGPASTTPPKRSVTTSPSPAPVFWTGCWTRPAAEAGGQADAVLRLTQRGRSVTGRFNWSKGGTVTASASGRTLTGTWKHTRGTAKGPFRFVLSADGQRFTGTFNNAYPWTGQRRRCS